MGIYAGMGRIEPSMSAVTFGVLNTGPGALSGDDVAAVVKKSASAVTYTDMKRGIRFIENVLSDPRNLTRPKTGFDQTALNELTDLLARFMDASGNLTPGVLEKRFGTPEAAFPQVAGRGYARAMRPEYLDSIGELQRCFRLLVQVCQGQSDNAQPRLREIVVSRATAKPVIRVPALDYAEIARGASAVACAVGKAGCAVGGALGVGAWWVGKGAFKGSKEGARIMYKYLEKSIENSRKERLLLEDAKRAIENEPASSPEDMNVIKMLLLEYHAREDDMNQNMLHIAAGPIIAEPAAPLGATLAPGASGWVCTDPSSAKNACSVVPAGEIGGRTAFTNRVTCKDACYVAPKEQAYARYRSEP